LRIGERTGWKREDKDHLGGVLSSLIIPALGGIGAFGVFAGIAVVVAAGIAKKVILDEENAFEEEFQLFQQLEFS
jgi:hypothetical protein